MSGSGWSTCKAFSCIQNRKLQASSPSMWFENWACTYSFCIVWIANLSIQFCKLSFVQLKLFPEDLNCLEILLNMGYLSALEQEYQQRRCYFGPWSRKQSLQSTAFASPGRVAGRSYEVLTWDWEGNVSPDHVLAYWYHSLAWSFWEKQGKSRFYKVRGKRKLENKYLEVNVRPNLCLLLTGKFKFKVLSLRWHVEVRVTRSL